MPPFVLGNLYILSSDLVSYILKNSKWKSSGENCLLAEFQGGYAPSESSKFDFDGEECQAEAYLRPVGDLEDVSIALWLLALKVHDSCLSEQPVRLGSCRAASIIA